MRRKILIILGSILVIVCLASIIFFQAYKSGTIQKIILNRIVNRFSSTTTSAQYLEQTNLVKQFLGFDHPQTYLLLFLNNTELRPGGGFIGVYGVVQIDKGVPRVLKVEGTEKLDLEGPQDFPSESPRPLKDYLGVSRWGFRDSNWNPDFSQSSKDGLNLYKKEHGLYADSMDAVIGFTPTVMEELLKITGPFSYEGKQFTSENFTENLEYEVERGYNDSGISFSDRKKILDGLTKEVLKKVALEMFSHWSDYQNLVERMLNEKHIMLYSLNADRQKIITDKGWGGTVKPSLSGQDFLLWVDANLGAWKTDHALKRSLTYSILPTSTGYIASATMKYVHSGLKDWRTNNYLTYTRIYVPLGSKLVGVINARKNIAVDQGVENGYQWFGTLTGVPVGKTIDLTFQYYLSPEVVSAIKKNTYSLKIQKQNGTINNALTLDLGFGRRVISASPGENPVDYGDSRYIYRTDLKLDRDFSLKLY